MQETQAVSSGDPRHKPERGRPRELGLNSSPSKLFSAPSSGHRRPKCTWEGETDRVWLGAGARAAGLTWSCQGRRPGSWVLLDPPAPPQRGRRGGGTAPVPPRRGLPLSPHPPKTARCSRPLHRGARRQRDRGPLLQAASRGWEAGRRAGRRGGGAASAIKARPAALLQPGTYTCARRRSRHRGSPETPRPPGLGGGGGSGMHSAPRS